MHFPCRSELTTEYIHTQLSNCSSHAHATCIYNVANIPEVVLDEGNSCHFALPVAQEVPVMYT